MQVFMSAEVLGALAGSLFPKPASCSQDSSGASTPADEVWSFNYVVRFVVNFKNSSTGYKYYKHDVFDDAPGARFSQIAFEGHRSNESPSTKIRDGFSTSDSRRFSLVAGNSEVTASYRSRIRSMAGTRLDLSTDTISNRSFVYSYGAFASR